MGRVQKEREETAIGKLFTGEEGWMRGKKVMNHTQFTVELRRSRCLHKNIDGAVNGFIHRPFRRDKSHGHKGGEPTLLSSNVRETRVEDELSTVIPDVQ